MKVGLTPMALAKLRRPTSLHDPQAGNVIALALYDIMEANDKHNNEPFIDPLGVDNAVHVILRALEKHGLRIVEVKGNEPC